MSRCSTCLVFISQIQQRGDDVAFSLLWLQMININTTQHKAAGCDEKLSLCWFSCLPKICIWTCCCFLFDQHKRAHLSWNQLKTAFCLCVIRLLVWTTFHENAELSSQIDSQTRLHLSERSYSTTEGSINMLIIRDSQKDILSQFDQSWTPLTLLLPLLLFHF